MSRARCASTRRCGICWIATTAWSRRRRRKNSLPISSSAPSNGRQAGRCRSLKPTAMAAGIERIPSPAARSCRLPDTQCAPPRSAWCCGLFAMHGIDSDHAHLVQGFSLHLAASLVRFREWSVVDRPLRRGRTSSAGFGAAILHRNHRLSGGCGNQHGDGAAGRNDAASMSGAKAFGSASTTGSRRNSASFAGSRRR